jgi:hypothetical protein
MAQSDFGGAATVVAGAKAGSLIYLWLSVVVILLDQLTKTLIEH